MFDVIQRGAVVALAIGAVACTSGSGDPLDPIPGSGNIQAVVENYPGGPYGTGVGKVIQNYGFQGYVHAENAVGEDAREQITLQDFFNPDGESIHNGEGIFPAERAKPKVLVLTMAALWCGPCKEEAAEVLPDKYATLGPRGLEIMLVLTESSKPGTPADMNMLDIWVDQYETHYPTVIDPTYQLGALVDTQAFPGNVIVDTETMTIVDIVTGQPNQGFWDKVDELLDD